MEGVGSEGGGWSGSMPGTAPADDGKRLEAHFSEQHAMDVVWRPGGKFIFDNGGGCRGEGARDCARFGGPAD